MCFNKKQFLIIGLLCARDGIGVCTCFYTEQPRKNSSVAATPKQNAPAQKDAPAQTVSTTQTNTNTTIPVAPKDEHADGRVVANAHQQSKPDSTKENPDLAKQHPDAAKPHQDLQDTPTVPAYEGRLMDAFNWPIIPIHEEKIEKELDLDSDDDLLSTATRVLPTVRPQANRRDTMLDGSKWALFTVAVISAGAMLYKS